VVATAGRWFIFGLHVVQPRQVHGLAVQPSDTVTRRVVHWITSFQKGPSQPSRRCEAPPPGSFPLGVPRGSSPVCRGSSGKRSSRFTRGARLGVFPSVADDSRDTRLSRRFAHEQEKSPSFLVFHDLITSRTGLCARRGTHFARRRFPGWRMSNPQGNTAARSAIRRGWIGRLASTNTALARYDLRLIPFLHIA